MALSDHQVLQVNQTLFSLTQIYRSRLAEQEKVLPTGLALSDRAVVMVLGQLAPVSAQQLSRTMDINPGTISVYLLRLEERGLITKERDTTDRRTWWLQLTDEGQSVFRGTVSGAVEYTRDLLSDLNEQEQAELHRLLTKAGRHVGIDWK